MTTVLCEWTNAMVGVQGMLESGNQAENLEQLAHSQSTAMHVPSDAGGNRSFTTSFAVSTAASSAQVSFVAIILPDTFGFVRCCASACRFNHVILHMVTN